MHDSQNRPVVIVGAGPAGMVLAMLLVRAGRRVQVVERHRDFKREFRGEGIQASVVKHLEEAGLLQELLDLGIAVPAQAARVYLDERQVTALKGTGDQGDFGIILHQERFLSFLHDRLSPSPLYQATFGAKVTGLVREAGSVAGVVVDDKSGARNIDAAYVVVTAGRGSALRRQAGLAARNVDTHFNILWLRLPRPDDESLVPQGFRADLSGDSLFIFYATADGDLQVAWSRRDEQGLKDRDFERKKARLLAEAPPSYQAWFANSYTQDTRSQFLKVQSDRLDRWWMPGALFLGDAAHTMSPVAGQGINLAIRDSIVTARHLLAAFELDGDLSEVGARVQAEREPEVTEMQRFQRGLGYFMLGAPRWQVRLFFKVVLPMLDFLGVRGRLLRKVQHGVSPVEIPAALRLAHLAVRTPTKESPMPVRIMSAAAAAALTSMMILGACTTSPEPTPPAPAVASSPAASLQADATAPGSAWLELSELDERVPVPQPPPMANHMRTDMRDHLVVVQEVVAALAQDDFDAVANAAERIASKPSTSQSCDLMGRGADGFTERALGLHRAGDDLLAAARAKDRAKTFAALNTTLATCTSCHATYRQEVVTMAEFEQQTGMMMSEHHRGGGMHGAKHE